MGAIKQKTEVFIAKAQAVHGVGKYDYSRAEYASCSTKVIIVCARHGAFKQTPESHLAGRGCRKCTHDANRMGDKSFIMKAQAVHGVGKYDYSRVRYKNLKTELAITCPLHGVFKQRPELHLSGYGCGVCHPHASRLGKDVFIARAQKAHVAGKYDYSQVEYVTESVKVTIICSKHGAFEQLPRSHVRGYGCIKCNHEKGGAGWGAARWASRQAGRQAQLYIVRFSDCEESFYKIGISFSSVKRRFSGKKAPYRVEQIAIFAHSDALLIHQTESAIHTLFKALKYNPKRCFSGSTECFADAMPILEHLQAQHLIKQAA